jgi:hypothetical protein
LWELALDAIVHDALVPILPDDVSLDTDYNYGGRLLSRRKVIDSVLKTIHRYQPSNYDPWTTIMKFDAAAFDTWLKSALKAQQLPSHPKRPGGRKPDLSEGVASFIAKRYPSDIPPGVTYKLIASDYASETGRRPSLRTVARALGRK